MGTVLRAELSDKNPYKIEKHRYLELKQFCLQYPVWRIEIARIDSMVKGWNNNLPKGSDPSDPVLVAVEKREKYLKWMDILHRVSCIVEDTKDKYVLTGVTQGLSYDILNAKYGIPYGKDEYYTRYRKFFWVLDRERG